MAQWVKDPVPLCGSGPFCGTGSTSGLGTSICQGYSQKKRTAIWSNNPISGYIIKGNEIKIWKKDLYPHIHSSIIHNSQDIKTTQMSNRRNLKEDVACIHSYRSIILPWERRKLTFMIKWMDPDIMYIMLSKIRQIQIPCNFTYMQNPKKKKKKLNSQKQAGECWCYQGLRRGGDKEILIKGYKVAVV